MQLTVKLYASLGRHLPPNAHENTARIDVANGATPAAVIAHLAIPAEHCHLVLVNGHYVPPSEHRTHPLAAGDTLAIWPPVAGGLR